MVNFTNNDLKIIKENLFYDLLNSGGIIDDEYSYNLYQLLQKLDKCNIQNSVKIDWSCFEVYIS